MDDHGILWGSQVVVPEAMQAEMLATAHEGHLGVVCMKLRCHTEYGDQELIVTLKSW